MFQCNAKSFAIVFFFFSFLMALFLDKRTSDFELTSNSCLCRYVWLRLKVLHWTHQHIIVSTSWNVVCQHGMPCALDSNDGSRQGHFESCLSLKTWYFHYRNAYDHKNGRMIAYYEWLGLQSIKSLELLIKSSCEIRWQTEIVKTLIPEWLRQPNLSGW